MSAYTAIASQTLTSSASSVTFSSIPGTFRDLVLVVNATSDSGGKQISLRLNSDTGSNYRYMNMRANGTSTFSSSFGFALSSIELTTEAALDGTSPTNVIINIMDYSATNKHKSTLSRANTASVGLNAVAGRWENTAAVTAITLPLSSGNYIAGSVFSLYGVSA